MAISSNCHGQHGDHQGKEWFGPNAEYGIVACSGAWLSKRVETATECKQLNQKLHLDPFTPEGPHFRICKGQQRSATVGVAEVLNGTRPFPASSISLLGSKSVFRQRSSRVWGKPRLNTPERT